MSLFISFEKYKKQQNAYLLELDVILYKTKYICIFLQYVHFPLSFPDFSNFNFSKYLVTAKFFSNLTSL